MQALTFTLSGKTAFFKKPDVNSYSYFTYGQLHKVVLLGMFGAILGYNGYGQKRWKQVKKGDPLTEEYPEFYEKLKHVKISIIPRNKKGYIPKKSQSFNNSVGYASAERGGNLIIKEQWLEVPIWDIYVMLDCEEANNLAESLLKNKCVFIPYLGSNDHPADIRDVQKIEIEPTVCNEERLACMFPKSFGEIYVTDDDEDDEKGFKYEERLPIRLNGYTNLYEYEKFCYTNFLVRITNEPVFRCGDKKLVFY